MDLDVGISNRRIISLVSRRLRDGSCAALSYYGPTPIRHGQPIIIRALQVTRSSNSYRA